MAEIEYTGDALVVHVKGMDKVWALKSQLKIPLQHVVGAEMATEDARRWWLGFRMPGTHIPGVIAAGTFLKDGRRVFWDVHDADKAISVHLRHDAYDELIVEVAAPRATIDMINDIVHRSRE